MVLLTFGEELESIFAHNFWWYFRLGLYQIVNQFVGNVKKCLHGLTCRLCSTNKSVSQKVGIDAFSVVTQQNQERPPFSIHQPTPVPQKASSSLFRSAIRHCLQYHISANWPISLEILYCNHYTIRSWGPRSNLYRSRKKRVLSLWNDLPWFYGGLKAERV